MARVNPIQVQKFLSGVDYPVNKDQIITTARSHGADKNVLDALADLPEGSYQTPADISEALGQVG